MKKFIYLSLVALILACSIPESTKDYNFVLDVKTEDTLALKYFNLIDHSRFNGSGEEASEYVKRHGFPIRLKIKSPRIMDVITFGDNKINTRIFVSPGDSITLHIANGQYEFIGEKASHYNFFKNIDSAGLKVPIYSNDLKDFKKQGDSIFKIKDSILKAFIAKNKVSESFLFHIQKNFEFEHLTYLLAPRKANGKIAMNEVLHLLNKSSKNEKFDLNSADYLNNIKIEDLQYDELLSNYCFKRSLIGLTRLYFSGNTNLEFTNSNFQNERDFILENFKGEIQEFCIANLILNYYNQAPRENLYNLKMLISEYLPKVKNNSYKTAIEEIKFEIDLLDTELPETVLNSKILNLVGDTLKVKDMLTNTNNSIRAIDFWASWCAPCIQEVMIAKDFREELSENYNVQWVYISIDEDIEKWIAKSEELSDYGLQNQQYLLIERKDSKLATFFDLKYIPRYVIMDENDKIIHGKAPRPSEEQNFKNIIEIIK